MKLKKKIWKDFSKKLEFPNEVLNAEVIYKCITGKNRAEKAKRISEEISKENGLKKITSCQSGVWRNKCKNNDTLKK